MVTSDPYANVTRPTEPPTSQANPEREKTTRSRTRGSSHSEERYVVVTVGSDPEHAAAT